MALEVAMPALQLLSKTIPDPVSEPAFVAMEQGTLAPLIQFLPEAAIAFSTILLTIAAISSLVIITVSPFGVSVGLAVTSVPASILIAVTALAGTVFASPFPIRSF